LVLQSGITRLVYQEAYKDTSGIDFLVSAGLEVLKIENIDDV
jgi:dCMP deaminase